MARKGFFVDDDGDFSMMRLLAFGGSATGWVAILASIPAMYLNNPQSTQMALIGAGLVGTSEYLKGQQKKLEAGSRQIEVRGPE